MNHPTLRRALCALAASAMLLTHAALAESITFTGTVTAGRTHEIYAPIGGTVAEVTAEAGETVRAGDALIALKTTKVYAEQAGTVTAVFGQVGDSAEAVAQKYGAVVVLEEDSVYSVSASIENAYNSTATRLVHVGESVYLNGYSDATHTGTGVITAIQGADYTVKVLTGEFLIGETVNVFRGGSAVSTQRIGRGTLNRENPISVSGSGGIVAFAVTPGAQVERGDLLFETLDGSFDGLFMSGTQIASDVDGVISQISAQPGQNLQKGSVAAVIYPSDAMRVEGKVPESSLGSVAVGDPVSIELIWNQDDGVTYPGTISMISDIANEGGDGVTYTVYVDFTPDADTRYGMSAVVTTQEKPAEGDDDASED